MMRPLPPLWVIAICGLMFSSLPQRVAGQAPPADPVQQLVEQLNAPDLQTRVEAERQLREFGTPALDALPDPRTLALPAAEAVRRIRTHLQRQQAQAALEATRVSLSGRHSLEAAVAAMSDQTGNQLDISSLPATLREQTLSFDLQDAPFWEAVAVIEQQASLFDETTDDRDTLAFRVRSEPDALPVRVVGPFRVSLVAASVRRDFTTPNRRLVRFTFNISTEPRLRPLFLNVADADLSVTLHRAVEGKDEEILLSPLSPSAQREIPVDRPGPVQFTHDVILPESDPALPASVSIRGMVSVELAADRERFVFRHLDEDGPVTRRHGGVSVTLEEVRHAGNELRAALRIVYEADGPHFESHRSWVFHNDVQLTTSEQQTLQPVEFETLDEGNSGVELRYRFTGVSRITGDTQLAYTAPTLITRVPVEFAFDKVAIRSEQAIP